MKTYAAQFTARRFLDENKALSAALREKTDLREARKTLWGWCDRTQFKAYSEEGRLHPLELAVVRDCIRAIRLMVTSRKESAAGFSLVQALWDSARGRERADLAAAFWADVIHIFRGAGGRSGTYAGFDRRKTNALEGREAALARSDELDHLWERARRLTDRYPHGLQPDVIERRAANRRRIMKALGATSREWNDWRWQLRRVARELNHVERLVTLGEEEREGIKKAREAGVPFGVTPYYLSLMDHDPGESKGRSPAADHAVRAQVFPDMRYVEEMKARAPEREHAFDFMLERDTSPIDLVTRRYAPIAIFKPYNTCPQICVYCQRNWEIEDVLDHRALASDEKVNRALEWLREHRAITEVLITGGDPLILSDDRLRDIMERLSAIDHIQRIRIGSRTPVTLPMRITAALSDLLASFRAPGRREIAVVTHVEHAYEVTPETVEAADRLKRRGISVYNQMVFTFENSRRFEAALLRRLLRLAGIDPYYTFNMKGKEETERFRVPMARLLQEQKEEARLLSGLDRTDEAVYNVPRLGKNYLRALQHRDLIGILPDGRRVYEFHPWEKQMMLQETYAVPDVAILPYLARLASVGEDPRDYDSIWYYF